MLNLSKEALFQKGVRSLEDKTEFLKATVDPCVSTVVLTL
jgi:hypothetical protein